MTCESDCIRYGHSAVQLDNYVIIVGGIGKKNEPLSTHLIWMYNLYTEEWSKHNIPDMNRTPKPFHRAVAAAIDGTIYVFGGDVGKFTQNNDLWMLSKAKTGCFTWNFIQPQCKEESPSPRTGYSGWEYAGNLWIFGGVGRPSPEGYLNYHGTFERHKFFRWNNQLLCYNPKTHKWINPQYFGAVPSPQSDHACATIKDKVWLFGGYNPSFSVGNDIFELTMPSLTWTQIQTGQPRPQSRRFCTLTAITDNQLVVHGGKYKMFNMLSDTWIMDLTSRSWRRYTSGEDHVRCCHTSSPGLSSNVIICYGCMDSSDTGKAYNNVFHVMLEPKCLQKLAMQIIHRYMDELPWNSLPRRLISRLGISLKEKRSRIL